MEEVLNFIMSKRFIVSAVIIIAALILWIVLRNVTRKYISESREKKNYFTIKLLGILKYLLLFITVLTVLQVNGINVSSLAASLGIVSAIVGLAMQDLLKDIIMGVNIMTDHFFNVGDVVRYKDIEGLVVSFNAKTTRLMNIYDNSITTICNRNISEITVSSAWVDMDLPLSYEESPEKINSVLGEAAAEIAAEEGIDDCVYKGVQRFDDSATVYKLRFFCIPENKPEMWRRAMRIVQRKLAEAEIVIPYNQLDIHNVTVGV